MSLHEELGGDEGVAAALDHFYEKVLADDRVNIYFDGRNVEHIKSQQKDFLAMALGGPNRYKGRDLSKAHARAREQGLGEEGYDVFMGHFRDTLKELGVPETKVEEVMAIAHTGKEEVLGQ